MIPIESGCVHMHEYELLNSITLKNVDESTIDMTMATAMVPIKKKRKKRKKKK